MGVGSDQPERVGAIHLKVLAGATWVDQLSEKGRDRRPGYELRVEGEDNSGKMNLGECHGGGDKKKRRKLRRWRRKHGGGWGHRADIPKRLPCLCQVLQRMGSRKVCAGPGGK